MKTRTLLIIAIFLAPFALGQIWDMTAFAQSYPADGDAATSIPAPPGNDPPVWNDIPVVNCTEAVASSTAMEPDFVLDPEPADVVALSNEGAALPTDISINNVPDPSTIDCGISTVAGNTSGIIIGANDGTNPTQNSDSFTIIVTAAASYESILSDAVGFGENVTGGKTHPLITVTNTNASGAGSLKEAIDAGGNRWIRFTKDLIGTITRSSAINMDSNNVTVDGRGADITIANSGFAGRAVNVTADNIALIYLKWDNGDLFDQSDALVATNTVDGLWIHQSSFTGTGDDQFSTTNAGAVAGVGNITISSSKFSGSSSVGPILINGNSGTPAGIPTQITMHHNDVSTGARGPFSRNARIHYYNNYVHTWNDSYVQSTCDSQVYFENNYADATNSSNTNVAKFTTQSCGAGAMFPIGNSMNGGATFGAQSPVEDVFDPTLSYTVTPDTANIAMRDAIISGSGWQNVVFPGDP